MMSYGIQTDNYCVSTAVIGNFKWHNTKEFHRRSYHNRSEETLVEEKEEESTEVVNNEKTAREAKEVTRKFWQCIKLYKSTLTLEQI